MEGPGKKNTMGEWTFVRIPVPLYVCMYSLTQQSCNTFEWNGLKKWCEIEAASLFPNDFIRYTKFIHIHSPYAQHLIVTVLLFVPDWVRKYTSAGVWMHEYICESESASKFALPCMEEVYDYYRIHCGRTRNYWGKNHMTVNQSSTEYSRTISQNRSSIRFTEVICLALWCVGINNPPS